MKWHNTWSYTQQDYRSWPSLVGPEMQRIQLISNHQAKKIRVGFSNLYGVEDIMFDAVSVRVTNTHNKIDYAPVKMFGNTMICIRPGEEFVSDPIDIEVEIGSAVEIVSKSLTSFYVTSGTVTYSKQELIIENYNYDNELISQTDQFKMVKENPRMSMIYGISSLHLLVPKDSKLIVAFGDSLTQQGFWVNQLKVQLRQLGKNNVTVLNRGIGGNRVLKGTDPTEDGYYRHGKAGLERFERDVFGELVPDKVIVLHGINDFVHQHIYPEDDHVIPEEVIEGLQKYREIIHEYGSEAIIATLTPLKNSIFYSPKLASGRQHVNEWIRGQKEYDLVLDFDEFIRNPEDEEKLDFLYDSGDGLHISDEGGKRIAKRIVDSI